MTKVGEITIEVHRKSEHRLVPFKSRLKDLASPSEVHEKALKGDAKSHGVS
jgi:hypothetical protein